MSANVKSVERIITSTEGKRQFGDVYFITFLRYSSRVDKAKRARQLATV